MLFPHIETSRLELRQIVKSDHATIFRGLSDPEVVSHYGISYKTKKEAQVQMDYYQYVWEHEEGIYWAICPQGNKELMGVAGLYNYNAEAEKAEAGFWLLPTHWRQGYMKEAMQPILRFGFTTLALHRVEALIESENTPAKAFVQSIGFTHEGTLRETEYKNDAWINLEMYSLLDREFKK